MSLRIYVDKQNYLFVIANMDLKRKFQNLKDNVRALLLPPVERTRLNVQLEMLELDVQAIQNTYLIPEDGPIEERIVTVEDMLAKLMLEKRKQQTDEMMIRNERITELEHEVIEKTRNLASVREINEILRAELSKYVGVRTYPTEELEETLTKK